MNTSPSRAEARRLVEDIGTQHGYIRQELLDRLSEADRREIEHAMLMKDRLIASSVITSVMAARDYIISFGKMF